jgi:hypothetical protein
MAETALLSVQAALLERMLETAVEETQAPIFSPILTQYLDTLLRSATEAPESLLEDFACLRFSSAGMEFFTPLSRIERVEYAADFRRRFAYQIPDYIGAGHYMLRVRDEQKWFFFDDILGMETLKSDEVIWRPNAAQAPWFIGTHRAHLCRIFDPEVLIDRQDFGKN